MKRYTPPRNFRESDNVFSRLMRLGVMPLLSLLAGGIVLLFVGANALDAPRTARDGKLFFSEDGLVGRFRVGSELIVQGWIAIAGAGFVMVSYGFSEACSHLFDWWCTRQARAPAGLDYGRYLNSQPRAPRGYGFRGFHWYAALRYVYIWGTMAMSVGYKFGIVLVSVWSYQAVSRDDLSVCPPSIEGLMGMSRFPNPWLGDVPQGMENGGFLHSTPLDDQLPRMGGGPRPGPAFGPDIDGPPPPPFGMRDPSDPPPSRVVMVPTIDCWMEKLSYGNITSREYVMVASMTEEQGDFFMTQDRDGWYRVGTTGTLWFNKTGERAVVEYRAPEPGKLQIQWAKQGDWFTNTDSNDSEPVAHRLTYEMRYAVAEVTRASMAHVCGLVQDFEDNSEVLRILAVDDAPFPAEQEDAHLSDISPWLDAFVADRKSDRRQGVSAIVRGAMTGWAFGSDRLRLLDNDEFPLGEEDASRTIRAERFPFMSYPFYAGMKADQTGCYTPAAVGFVFVGLLSIATAALRIWVGPAELTSWTAQHVYLSQIGALNMMHKQDALATGYQPAPAELGYLRLHSRPSTGQSESSAYTNEKAWSFESNLVRFNDLPRAKEVSQYWHKELG